MSDETYARREMTATAPEAVRPTPTDPARQLPAEAEAAHGLPDYEDPELARAEIDATRARMSDTIEEIEDALVRKRQRFQDRLDLLAPVRERPLHSMGIALGAGLLLGLLTGGSDDEAHERLPARRPDLERRAALLEARTRRLLAIAREQEEQIERLQQRQRWKGKRKRLAQRVKQGMDETRDELADAADTATHRLEGLRDAVVDGLGTFLGDALRQLRARR